jgi:multidrug efflux pump subunit AcrB
MKLTEYAVKNYQFTLVLFVMVTIVGIVTLLTMPRAEDPQINPPIFPVIAVYPGTSPKDMEELVVKPIEKKMYELENINKIVTTIEDGLAVLRVEFKYGVDVENKYQELVREISTLKSDLPSDLYSLEVKKTDPSDVSILQIALVSENASYQTLRRNAEELKEQLEKITALKNVDFSGCPEEIVRVDVHVDKVAEQSIPLSAVVGSLQSEAANIPGGIVHVSTKSFNVKTSGKYESVEEIANTVVWNANGKIIVLRDVADVGITYAEDKHITRINGHRCVLVNAAQKIGSNITQNQARILPILDDFEKTLPANIKLIRAFDQAENVAHRLGSLGVDFALAIVLVLITLSPLGLRAAFVVMIAIPLSLALGLVGLNALGFSLNQLSIVGLVVALGLLVDDSIVVVENIERWLRDGYSRREAAVRATKQIALAVLGCTATLVISFLPLIFLPGGPGEFVRGLPMAVITSVIASMIVSLTIVPFLASRILRTHHNPEGNIFLRFLKKLISGSYSRLLERALKRPVLTLVVSLLIFAGSLALFGVIGFRLFPTSEKPIFLVNVRMPLQMNLEENQRITAMIEDSLRGNPDIVYFTSNVGKGNPQIYYNVAQQEEKSDFAQIFVQLGGEVRPPEKKRVIEALRAQFEQFPLAKIEVKDFDQGPPIEAPISVRILGDNLDTLRRLATSVEQIVRQSPGAIYTNNELNVLKTDLKVRINKEKARTLGVLTVDVDKTVRMAIAGLEVGTYTDDKGDDYTILVTIPKNTVTTLAAFENLYVNNAIGTAIPLSQIAAVTFETSPTTINHFNKNRFAKITAFTEKGVLANTVLKDVVPKLEAMSFPMGYSYTLAGEAESESDAFGGGFVVVILLTIFLFIAVLILQFKTFKGIVVVLSVIPLGVVGGVTMLFLTGNPMSFIAIIGFIGLAGIEVKNSILLVDFTNQLRSEGMELNKAIEQAGEIRFLPVVLTSLTAIGGLIPIALNPNPQISPLALVLIGGLISSTVLSRIVTPVLYKLIPPEVAVDSVVLAA